MNRLANCSYTPNSDHSVVTFNTPVPHAGSPSARKSTLPTARVRRFPVTGRYFVTTIPNGANGPDPNRFTINASGTGTSTLSISNATVFPLLAPPLDRSGALDLFNSTWLMNVTDGESTTASLTQTPMHSQTVFNFYYPEFSYPGDLARDGVTTPEFQLTSDTNVMLLTNFLEQGIQQSSLSDGRTSFRAGGGAIVLDMSPYLNATYTASALPGSNSGIDKLVSMLNDDLMGGTMSLGHAQLHRRLRFRSEEFSVYLHEWHPHRRSAYSIQKPHARGRPSRDYLHRVRDSALTLSCHAFGS